MKRLNLAAIAVTVLGLAAGTARAQETFQVIPFTYDPGNVCNESATWISGGVDGAGDAALRLTKPCPTATEASAGADIVTSLEGGDVSALTELNFAYQNGGHCGAGAPRFNVVVAGQTYFLGCSSGTHTALNDNWTLVEFTATDFATAGIPTTGTLEDIAIVFDEGTDTPVGGTIGTAGTVVIDNFSVNGVTVGAPSQPMTKDDCKNGGWMLFQPPFKNQGQCVSAVVSNRGGNRARTVNPGRK
jgi:hypothetical protein